MRSFSTINGLALKSSMKHHLLLVVSLISPRFHENSLHFSATEGHFIYIQYFLSSSRLGTTKIRQVITPAYSVT